MERRSKELAINALHRRSLWLAAVACLAFPANPQDRTDPNPPEPHLASLYPEAGQI